MILKYGNQTVDFYTKIQSLIKISPYREKALRDVPMMITAYQNVL